MQITNSMVRGLLFVVMLIALIGALLALSSQVQVVPAEDPYIVQTGQALELTATYGAEQWNLQLTEVSKKGWGGPGMPLPVRPTATEIAPGFGKQP